MNIAALLSTPPETKAAMFIVRYFAAKIVFFWM
jgi:hypothetical protein